MIYQSVFNNISHILVDLQPIVNNLARNSQNNFQSLIIFQISQMQRKPWSFQQDSSLKILVEEVGLSNWTLIAARQSKACPGSLRTGKQCRQRWINHLDIKICKKAWTKNQEKIIFKMHNIHGNKWKEIAKYLKARTQNDIKNHFYATMRKGIRRLNRLLSFTKNPLSIRNIKPVVMSKVCEQIHEEEKAKKQAQNCQGVFDLILELSRYDPPFNEGDEVIEHQHLIKQSQIFLNRILQQNRKYEQQKLKKKISKINVCQPSMQVKSEQLNKQFDISQYLCLGQIYEDKQDMRPKSQGAIIDAQQYFSEQECNTLQMS